MAGLALLITWVNTLSRWSFVYCHYSVYLTVLPLVKSVHFYLTYRLCYERNAQLESKGNKVLLQQEPFILTIITPLMQRILQTYSIQPQSIFIDSSALCDQVNTSLTLVLIAAKAGAVPIGVSLHDSQTKARHTVFSQLREWWAAISPIQLMSIMTMMMLQWKMHLPPFGLDHGSYYACFMFCRHCGAVCGTQIIVYPRRRKKTWWMTSNELCIQHRW